MAAIIFSSFLSLVALGRAFAFGFWRPLVADAGPLVDARRKEVRKLSKLQYLPVLLLIAMALAVGLLPSYLYDLSTAGAKLLLNPEPYISAVLGGAK